MLGCITSAEIWVPDHWKARSWKLSIDQAIGFGLQMFCWKGCKVSQLIKWIEIKPKQFWNTFDIQLEFAMLIRYLIQENLGIADSPITENNTGSRALEKVFWTWLSVIQVIPLCWLVNYVGNSWFLSKDFRWSPACCTPCKRFWTRVCKVWLGLQTLSCLIFTNKSWHQ